MRTLSVLFRMWSVISYLNFGNPREEKKTSGSITGIYGLTRNSHNCSQMNVNRDPVAWPCPCIFQWHGIKCDRVGNVHEM